ncbi:hypothetical protein EGI26_16845 [Lacihabitans sp. CCS-44]|uniref:hypothetical protein n=1 Tax=Lacihabitans sp. CCS-44 TaxID=2487331 RepID=UPI0020CE140F|nr:hypothetical protein [Lacihabitans sp. CCS-44]MCP9756835.1 hypothetical protein [Lacihabitans sp. CCS-44]
MKQKLTLLLVFLSISSSFATLRRVNNNVGIVPVATLVYTTLDAAIADAVNGDTIYVEPSTTSYSMGSVLIKRLIFIGDGYQKGSNANLISPLSFSLNESIITANFAINTGAENSAFIGMRLNGDITVNASNILFKRCSFTPSNSGGNLVLNSSSNIVEQCFFSLNGGGHGDINGSGSGNIFRNCIIQDIMFNQVNPLVDQCFLGGVQTIVNGTFTNCIVGTNNYSVGTNSTFSFSIKIGAVFGTPGSNNIENAVLSDVFESSSPTFDKNYRLKVGSSAIGTGNTGQNIGPFGGADPYRLSGQAGIPTIRNFFLSTTGSTASGLSGSITVQSNN